jgi:indole-3-glycerol phosphate synthase
MILNEITAHKKEMLAETKRRVPFSEVKAKASDAAPVRGFGKALSQGGTIRLIAEVKKASPSKGVIRETFDPVTIARVYEEYCAACISVLTEEKYQIFEARAAGADAILLIAACLEKEQMKDYLGIAGQLDLDVLVESHTYPELDKSLLAGASLVGINNRDLTTFEVSLRTTLDLLKDIPEDRTVVSESGIKTRDDVVLLEKAGVDAILVGESLMREKDIGKKVKELLGK